MKDSKGNQRHAEELGTLTNAPLGNIVALSELASLEVVPRFAREQVDVACEASARRGLRGAASAAAALLRGELVNVLGLEPML